MRIKMRSICIKRRSTVFGPLCDVGRRARAQAHCDSVAPTIEDEDQYVTTIHDRCFWFLPGDPPKALTLTQPTTLKCEGRAEPDVAPFHSNGNRPGSLSIESSPSDID
jgi:hypothetical protein